MAQGAKLNFQSTEPFDTLKAQILAKVDSNIKVKAGKLRWENFEVTWVIRGHAPTHLRSEEDWKGLLEELTERPHIQVMLKIIQTNVSSECLLCTVD